VATFDLDLEHRVWQSLGDHGVHHDRGFFLAAVVLLRFGFGWPTRTPALTLELSQDS
jgi:hypothetical protein